MAVYRLAKVASELNRSTSAIAEFLQEKGHDVQARPTTKITEEMYSECLKEFSADKAMKEEADKLKEQKPARPTPSAPISSAPATSALVEEPAPIARRKNLRQRLSLKNRQQLKKKNQLLLKRKRNHL